MAHLAALELRPSLYLAQGYGSLFAYCTQALHLSEDSACNRIDAARACRRFPAILDLLATGSLTLTSVRMLKGHLTPENHAAVLARASNRNKEEIAVLIAELAPKPDVPATVRKLPARKIAEDTPPDSAGPSLFASRGATTSAPYPIAGAVEPPVLTPRPIVQPLSPQRYRVQFTIGQKTHDKLRRVQALLRREVPNGDPGVISDRFLDVLLEKIERTKLGKTARPRRRPCEGASAGRAYEDRRHNQYEAELVFGPRPNTVVTPG